MSEDPFDRIEALYEAAKSLSLDEQKRYLDQHCHDPELRRQVESMLAAGAQAGPAFETKAMADDLARALAAAGGALGTECPRLIGRYRIVGRLGAGGMGIVYEAEQESPRRRVALKVMRSDLLSRQAVQRFGIEAHVLGQLHHPGIAQVYESGFVDGEDGRPQPYFAMELITGQSLLSYVRVHNCSHPVRLELMIRIAEAVQHAHQKGVIHRDLKPDNILVDESGQPKVLDFGVARAADADVPMTTLRTNAGQIIGTLAYMSPEQISGRPDELDTRSDVYALGVILYELLGGALPHDVRRRSVPDAIRMIQDEEPARLSSIDARFRGDLDTIVRKAMEKEKSRRYQSAEAFAGDLRRFLRDEPILARPATTLYQFRKFAKRNKVLVGAIAVVVIALAAGFVASTAMYLRSERNLTRALRAEQDATRETAVAQEVSRFLASLFESSDPGRARGREVTARELLDQGAERILTELEEGSEVRGRLLNVMGDVYLKLGSFDAARPLILEAASLHERLHPPLHPDAIQSRELRARMHIIDGEFAPARSLLKEGLELLVNADAQDARNTWTLLNLLAAVANREGRYEESRDFNERSLEVVQRLPDPEMRRQFAPRSHHAIGLSFYLLGEYEKSEVSYRLAVEGFREAVGEAHPSTAIALSGLGLTQRWLRRYDDAQRTLREAARIGAVVWGEESVNLASILNNLALVLESLGEIDESVETLQRIVRMYEASYGADHSVTALGRANLGSVLITAGRYAEAEVQLDEAIRIQSAQLGLEHPDTIASNNHLGLLYERLGRWEEAESLNRDQHARLVRREGETAHRTLHVLGRRAEALRHLGRLEEATLLRLREYQTLRDHHGRDHPRTQDVVLKLAELHLLTEASDDAEQVLQVNRAQLLAEGHHELAEAAIDRARQLLSQFGREDRADRWTTP